MTSFTGAISPLGGVTHPPSSGAHRNSNAKAAGVNCRRCQISEARCAYVAGCCIDCTHFTWPTRAIPTTATQAVARVSVGCAQQSVTVARLHDNRRPFVGVCGDCWQMTKAHRLISTAVAEIAALHGKRPALPLRHALGAVA